MDDQPKKQQDALTGWKLAGTILCALVGGVIGILGFPDFAIFTTPNSAAPADSLDLAVAIMLLTVLSFCGGILARRTVQHKALNATGGRLPLRRPANKIGSRFLRYQLVLLFVLFVYFNENSWTVATVGFTQESSIVAFICGVLAYGLLIFTLGLLFRLRGITAAQDDNTMTNMAALWPREPRQKLAMTIAVCVINPVSEELLFRGILVYQLALTLDNYELPLFLGLLATLWNHAYQGQQSILLHTLYYVFAVALLFSPAGMMGAIGMHYAGDIVPVSFMKSNMKKYRERHRRSAKPFEEGLPIPPIEG